MSERNPELRFNSVEAMDKAYLLHPNTDALKHLDTGPLLIERGEGVHVFDTQGRKYLEAVSGLWSVGVGFSEPRLVDAAARQMAQLPFYHSFFHRGSIPAAELARKLIEIAPAPMGKVFFTNSGSEANDTVAKLLWYRANALGEPRRKKIITRSRAYHGVTSVATSLTSLPVFHQSFDLVVPGMVNVTAAAHYLDGHIGESEEAFSARLAEELEQRILEEGPDTICAFMAEPLMTAAGVFPPPAGYWKRIQEVLGKYGVLLVIDEVVTGFGRTGKMFGCETYDIEPDVLVLSKQLSSSYLPISAILFKEHVVTPIMEESGRIGTLAHGFTGGGHPVCAAVALENIRIIEDDRLVDNSAAMGARLLGGLHDMADHPLVAEVRGCGLLAAVQLAVDKGARVALDPPGRLAALVNEQLLLRGVIARATGDAIGLCPPMIISAGEVDEILRCLRASLDAVWNSLSESGELQACR